MTLHCAIHGIVSVKVHSTLYSNCKISLLPTTTHWRCSVEFKQLYFNMWCPVKLRLLIINCTNTKNQVQKKIILFQQPVH